MLHSCPCAQIIAEKKKLSMQNEANEWKIKIRNCKVSKQTFPMNWQAFYS